MNKYKFLLIYVAIFSVVYIEKVHFNNDLNINNSFCEFSSVSKSFITKE